MAAIGDYEIGDEIGQGPLGKVYKATHVQTGQTVVFRGFTKPADADDALWEHCIARYTDELSRARELEHPCIATIYDFGALENLYWVATEFFTGRTFKRVLDQEGTKDVGFTLGLLEQIGSALEYALGKGLIHTDLTPYNVLFLEGGMVKLINFGLGHIREKWGSAYVSPEQVRNETPTERSDVFSLGVLAYECLAGDSPYLRHDDDATAAAVLALEPEPIEGVADAPMQVILKMLSKEPSERYENAPAAVRALDEAVKSDIAPTPVGPPARAAQKKRAMDGRPSLAQFNLQESDARSAIEGLRSRLMAHEQG